MAKIPQPEFMLLKDAARRFKVDVDSILALAGESKLTLWACYTAEQFNSQIIFTGQSKNEYWALGAADIRELRTVGRICINPPAQSGLLDSEGHYAQLSGGHEAKALDVVSPVPHEPVYFRKSIKKAEVEPTWLYVRIEELTAVLDEYRKAVNCDNRVDLAFYPNTILVGIYKRLHPNGKWKQCQEISFQDWAERCMGDQSIVENGIVFTFENIHYELFIDKPSSEHFYISAGFIEVGQPIGKLKNYTAEKLEDAIKPNKIKRLLDNPSFQFIKGCTF